MDKKELKNKIQEYCNNKIICLIVLIIFAPIGFIMTAANKTFKPIVKGIILFVFAFVALYEILFLVSAGGNKLVALANGDNKPKTEQVATKPVKKVEIKKEATKANDNMINEVKEKAKVDAVEDAKYSKAMSSETVQLGNDIQNELNDLTNEKIDSLKQDGIQVTNDCNNIESLNPTDTFYSIHEQLKEVCETYKNVYGNLYDKIQNGDVDWINQQKDVLSKANQETQDITKQINALTGK